MVRLEPGTTKNKDGRTVYLDEEMLTTFRRLFSERRLNTNHVFLRDGEPIHRYDITSGRDFQEAMLKRSTYIQEQDQDLSGKVTLFQQKGINANVH